MCGHVFIVHKLAHAAAAYMSEYACADLEKKTIQSSFHARTWCMAVERQVPYATDLKWNHMALQLKVA